MRVNVTFNRPERIEVYALRRVVALAIIYGAVGCLGIVLHALGHAG